MARHNQCQNLGEVAVQTSINRTTRSDPSLVVINNSITQLVD